MSNDSTALSATEQSALDFLTIAAQSITKVKDQARRLEELELANMEQAEDISDQSRFIETLTARIHELEALLTGETARRIEAETLYTNTQAELRVEQALAGQHWADLTSTRANLTRVEGALAQAEADLTSTLTQLGEAEDKLARFRDILGLPHPVPQQSGNPVSPSPAPLPDYCKSLDPAPETSIGEYIGLGGADTSATFPEQSLPSTDPAVALAVDNWYNS